MMMNFIQRCWVRTVVARTGLREERGQTFVEYSILVALIAVGVAAAVPALRDAITVAIGNAVTALGL